MNIQKCINMLIAHLPGVEAVISPGSRNAPVAYALHHSDIRCHSIVDERSAGFFALGLAKALKKPVILSCTSGTAVLNYYPAIAEAYYARVPLIVLTADRPPEQIDAWDGQAIRQKAVFAQHIRASFQTPDYYEDTGAFAAIAHQVISCIDQEIDGPIHINIPIREPFYKFTDEGLKTEKSKKLTSVHSHVISLAQVAAHTDVDFTTKRVLVFCGMDDGENIVIEPSGAHVQLADVTSSQSSDVSYWDALLYATLNQNNGLDYLKVLKPDVLITTGTTTVSKGLKFFLRRHKPAYHFHLTTYLEVGDMFQTKPVLINPNMLGDTDGENLSGENNYLSAWQNLTAEFESRFGQLDWTKYNEFTCVNYLLSQLSAESIIHVGNSMPVRYVSFLQNDKRSKPKVYANRGTSGIDGSTSTAVGHATSTDELVYLITGDISFFYDVNGLYNENLPSNLRIAMLNNSAGGIFEMINGPEAMGDALGYQVTEHNRNAENLAAHFGLEYYKADSPGSFGQGVEWILKQKGAAILEIQTNRESNKSFLDLFKAL